jgi:hypothetical protein
MKKLMKKATGWVIKSAVVAVAGKIGLMVLKKVNKDGHLEEKANDMIDEKAEKAKEVAKAGVAKTLHVSEIAEDKLEMSHN